MDADREQTDAEALRDLAGRIIADSVDVGQLQDFMRDLLETHLVELPAVCRREAALLARSFQRLRPLQLAMLLRQTASQLESK